MQQHYDSHKYSINVTLAVKDEEIGKLQTTCKELENTTQINPAISTKINNDQQRLTNIHQTCNTKLAIPRANICFVK